MINNGEKGSLVRGKLNSLFEKVDNLQNNQSTGVSTYQSFTDLPTTGTVNTSYKVVNDATSSKNGFYTWSGTAYIKDANLINGSIVANNIDAVTGGVIYDHVLKNSIVQNNVWCDTDNSTAIQSSMNSATISVFKMLKDIWFSKSILDLTDLKISIITITKDYNGDTHDYKITIQLSQNGTDIGSFSWSNVRPSNVDEDIHLHKQGTFLGVVIECDLIVNFADGVADSGGSIINTADKDLIRVRPKQNTYYATEIKGANELATRNSKVIPHLNNYFIDNVEVFNNRPKTEREAFKAIGDVWVSDLKGSIYENYEFCIYYLGKSDATYKDIFYLGRRATPATTWEITTVATGSDNYWIDGKVNHKTCKWDGVLFNFVVFPEHIPTSYQTLHYFILNLNEQPTTGYGKNYISGLSILNIANENKSNIEAIVKKDTKSINQVYEYLTSSPYKNKYNTGHSLATDILKNQSPPGQSTIKSITTVANVFSEEGHNYIVGSIKEDVRLKLQQYEVADGKPIRPLTLKGKVFNSHATESITIGWGVRLLIDGNWLAPSESYVIPPQETKEMKLTINDGSFNWSQLGADAFDLWIRTQTTATALSPAWAYFGDCDMYWLDEKERDSRPYIQAKAIEKGIKASQLDDDLQLRLSKITPDTTLLKKSIAITGSSITWGNGELNASCGGEVDNMIKSELSSTIVSNSSTLTYTGNTAIFTSNGMYKSKGVKMTTLGCKVNFDMYGDEIAICHAIQRTVDYGLIKVKADGVTIGEFTNKNDTLGSGVESFTGDGTSVRFLLKHPHTYNHTLLLNSVAQNVVINTGGYGSTIPVGSDAMIIRAFDASGEVVHMIWFKTAPANGVTIGISYDYGKVIYHENSTVGQLDNNDQLNESTYGFGSISFDPASPSAVSSGMEFRSIDKRAFYTHKFTELKTRTFEIEIIGGVNPYFVLNFITNKFHNFMNAGIGGWTLAALLDNSGINNYNNFFKDFIPDIIVNEFSTNDDWGGSTRRLTRTVTGITEAKVKELYTLELSRIEYKPTPNTYEVDFTNGLISVINKLGLTSPQIINSGVIVGDIVRIGNYYGDNKQVVVREVETVNTTTGAITWIQPLNVDDILNINVISDLVGAEVSIRDLSQYKAQYVDLITKLQKVAPQAKLLITNSGLSNYFLRQLWGYDIIHRSLSTQFNNIDTIEITNWLYDFQQGNIDGSNNETIIANNSDNYTLSQTGHWQGFEVWVDGANVYGRDCYVRSGQGYGIDPALTGVGISITGSYNKSYSLSKPMELVFFQNKPVSGDIIIKKANSVWSTDYCHPNDVGAYVYGQAYINKIKSKL